MKYIASLLLSFLLCTTAIAQSDSAAIAPPTSGEVESNIPAATTGTAPLDTNVPSGTGTTGTSGTTMAEAERHNESNTSLLWLAVLAAFIAGIIVLMRKRKRS